MPKVIKHSGLHVDRLCPEAHNPREVAFAEQWKAENEPRVRTMTFHGSLLSVLIERIEDPRTATDVATVIQWLGSNVGFSFLEASLNRCGYRIVKGDAEDQHQV